MLKRKKTREKGKIKLSRYFQKLSEGDKVAVVREHSLKVGFPKQIQGRTGKVEEKRGECWLVKISLHNTKRCKTYIIHPVHLKKLKA